MLLQPEHFYNRVIITDTKKSGEQKMEDNKLEITKNILLDYLKEVLDFRYSTGGLYSKEPKLVILNGNFTDGSFERRRAYGV